MDLHGWIDYHNHTAVTVDAVSTVDACCRQASELGLAELAFTNHMILGNPDFCMSPTGMKHLWQQIQDCQPKYPQLTLRLGAEVDYFEGREADITALLQQYEKIAGRPFDFVMGAVHYLRGVFFSSSNHAPALFLAQASPGKLCSETETRRIYTEYFDQVVKAIRSGLFNTIAHVDLIKKYADELAPRIPFMDYRAEAEQVVCALVESQVGIEINTKGLLTQLAEFFPSNDLLWMYVAQAKSSGVEPILTIGSDSHKPENVGALIAEGVQAVRRVGATALSGFSQGTRYSIPIDQNLK